MDCLRIPNWRDPDFVTLRDAYALHERRRRSPKATLYPGDAETLAAVPDALAYTPIYAGKAPNERRRIGSTGTPSTASRRMRPYPTPDPLLFQFTPPLREATVGDRARSRLRAGAEWAVAGGAGLCGRPGRCQPRGADCTRRPKPPAAICAASISFSLTSTTPNSKPKPTIWSASSASSTAT